MFCNLLFLVIFLLCPAYSHNNLEKSKLCILDEVLRFCEGNGKKYITITSIHSSKQTMHQAQILLSLSQQRKMYAKVTSWHEVVTQMNTDSVNGQMMDMTIILTSCKEVMDRERVMQLVETISETKIRSCILAVIPANYTIHQDGSSSYRETKFDVLYSVLSEWQRNAFFYVTFESKIKDRRIWNQIITLRGDAQVIVNEMEFEHDYRVIER